MHLHRKLAPLAATALAAAALALLPPAAAHATARPAAAEGTNAAPACSDAGFTRTSPYGKTFEVYWCDNVAPTPVHADEGDGSTIVGTLKTSHSWFACRIDNGPDNGSSVHPHRWLMTEADDTHAWGMVPDKHIYSETDPVPSC
ncbi:hypothetical protein [Streptomyces celluloflavus]|uniref:Secreted protein n=1 Tax=Streptomyces celluloflavus TaxID=58344 RepID=A0ABW7RQS6_9ACTN